MPEENANVRPVRRGAIGILERNGAYLMVQRAAGVTMPGAWCFPGGHVEPDETPRRAVVREMAEELGIVVEPTLRLGAVRVVDSRYILGVWKVTHVSGEFRPEEKEIAGMRWMALDEIAGIKPGMASNAMVVRLLNDRDGGPLG
jgi:8-oxo-dGTP diphosphatase